MDVSVGGQRLTGGGEGVGQKVVDDGYPIKAATEVRLPVRNPLVFSGFGVRSV